MPYDIPDMYSKPGTPCNDYSGYCDVFQMCREVDPSGPLATLRQLLLSEESFASFKKWVLEYWYAVAAIIAFVIALLVSFLFFFCIFKDLYTRILLFCKIKTACEMFYCCARKFYFVATKRRALLEKQP